ncbi:aldehyde dehydrogenase (NADP(+)) [Chitinophaga ginsengisegetis]|uniref:aldehyde dehydrogenase (NADP(+)) n=1 Tax=Chitinophaga ginsengisegetis TaxID=393003 RepID=UPI000DBAC924|nr:aldehyde dehydrogenase (NADP(+)) [Chitinophaga ginsengisegetis]MDR6569845.1 NADP-dependent aldehyde dehydrogenase [Chitinophaga ginsengisegetis]MDR6649578.1 NADP-dependent aldehyde dehydrogenase [Chitinophaga ginsengisegetis]MDR6656219.1 NADP-dependent aldehyde dehydrogenase [Chitinophaga ginsengisegetis]
MITGKNIIGFAAAATGTDTLRAYDPVSNATLPEMFATATTEEVNQAVEKASTAFKTYRHTSPEQRAVFLEAIATEILAIGDPLLERTVTESGLPLARITGERMRTVNQLRLFAAVLREGSWVEAIIDPAQPERTPLPRADIRKMLVPLGPVLVFPASNFPLAFSTAGGDTASALAAGNPVIVKAHESHLGTNELVATAIQKAAQSCGMPDGVFSSLNGAGALLGQQLVKHPGIKAIGFTGSFKAGTAIFDAVNQRAEPIPVYAEMGSINPVLLLPGKLEASAQQTAQQYAQSITLGTGQFCTNPGLLIALAGNATEQFAVALQKEMAAINAGTMLNPGICYHYYENREQLSRRKGVQTLYAGPKEKDATKGSPALYRVDAKDFIASEELQQEVFGPASLLVVCNDDAELSKLLLHLHGQLTGTVMASATDLLTYADAVEILCQKVGRVILNNVPTGVEPGYAMHHGGPFPATTDIRSTSVGASAIVRFARPLCFQDWPQQLLPDALKDENPLGIWRKIDGQLTKDTVSR